MMAELLTMSKCMLAFQEFPRKAPGIFDWILLGFAIALMPILVWLVYAIVRGGKSTRQYMELQAKNVELTERSIELTSRAIELQEETNRLLAELNRNLAAQNNGLSTGEN